MQPQEHEFTTLAHRLGIANIEAICDVLLCSPETAKSLLAGKTTPTMDYIAHLYNIEHAIEMTIHYLKNQYQSGEHISLPIPHEVAAGTTQNLTEHGISRILPALYGAIIFQLSTRFDVEICQSDHVFYKNQSDIAEFAVLDMFDDLYDPTHYWQHFNEYEDESSTAIPDDILRRILADIANPSNADLSSATCSDLSCYMEWRSSEKKTYSVILKGNCPEISFNSPALSISCDLWITPNHGIPLHAQGVRDIAQAQKQLTDEIRHVLMNHHKSLKEFYNEIQKNDVFDKRG